MAKFTMITSPGVLMIFKKWLTLLLSSVSYRLSSAVFLSLEWGIGMKRLLAIQIMCIKIYASCLF